VLHDMTGHLVHRLRQAVHDAYDAQLFAIHPDTLSEARDRRIRIARADRAFLNDDLGSICEYAQECSKVAAQALQYVGAKEKGAIQVGRPDPLTCPELPRHVLNNLARLIENLDDKNATSVADLVGCYQVQHARLADMLDLFNNPGRPTRTMILTSDNVQQTFEQTVGLQMRAGRMFDFARRRADAISSAPFTADEIVNAMNNLEIFDLISPDYRNLLMRILPGA